MMNARNARGAGPALLVGLTLAAGCGPLPWDADAAEASSAGTAPAAAAAETHPSFLYGRVTTVDGDTYQGRLRFGGDEEAFWGDHFNGFKDGNPWAAQVPSEALREKPRTLEFLGFEISRKGRELDLRRPFMARFGDISKIEARGRDLRITLKSGTEFDLDRYAADDFADGLRVWDAEHGVVEFHERRIRTIELLPSTGLDATAPYRLHGTVRTRQGDFTGFIQWGREGSVALDELDGHDTDGELLSLPFVTIRSIARQSPGSARVTLLDGREMVLSDSRHVGEGNRGIYVDDPRYGRVLISWNALDRTDFSVVGAGSPDGGPAYGDFPTGGPLTGTVTTRDGRRLAGRLVYDLDESETTETLDAPFDGVDYTIPFERIASIVLPDPDGPAAGHARVILRSGEELRLERAGDLGDGNAGMLVFGHGREGPAYVPWHEVERVELRSGR